MTATPEQRASYNARLLLTLDANVDDPRHGITGYRAGHRCDVCNAANNATKARQRSTRRTATGAP